MSFEMTVVVILPRKAFRSVFTSGVRTPVLCVRLPVSMDLDPMSVHIFSEHKSVSAFDAREGLLVVWHVGPLLVFPAIPLMSVQESEVDDLPKYLRLTFFGIEAIPTFAAFEWCVSIFDLCSRATATCDRRGVDTVRRRHEMA